MPSNVFAYLRSSTAVASKHLIREASCQSVIINIRGINFYGLKHVDKVWEEDWIVLSIFIMHGTVTDRQTDRPRTARGGASADGADPSSACVMLVPFYLSHPICKYLCICSMSLLARGRVLLFGDKAICTCGQWCRNMSEFDLAWDRTFGDFIFTYLVRLMRIRKVPGAYILLTYLM